MQCKDSEQSPVKAVVYAAKSTEDKRQSIATQLADCRAAATDEGRAIVAEFSDEAASAYKSNRGDGLSAAKDAAIKVGAELWVQHSDRLARGDGISADHLAEVWFALRRHGVRLRSVQDDANLEDAIRVVLIGERNFEDSARKSAATSKGKRRAAERGEFVGGIRPDGYRIVHEVDERGQIKRRMELDPEREPIYRLIWNLALDGYSANAITFELDRHGFQTAPYKRDHKPRPFEANRIVQTLDNPVYAGQSVYKGEVVAQGQWPAYVTPDEFARLKAERAERAHVSKRRPGRPPERYVLARVAVCGECGAPMDAITGRYVRSDGTRPRRYYCRQHRQRPQACSAYPIDASVVDAAFVANLDSFLGDVAGWQDKLVDTRHAERERIGNEVARADADLATARDTLEAMQRRYAKALARGDDDRADSIEAAMVEQRAELSRAESRLRAAQDAVEATSVEQSLDPLLDFFTDLRTELNGRAKHAKGDVKRLNLVVQDYFERVELTHEGPGVRVVPVLSWATVERIAATGNHLSDSLVFKRAVLSRPQSVIAVGDEQIVPPLRAIRAIHNPQPPS